MKKKSNLINNYIYIYIYKYKLKKIKTKIKEKTIEGFHEILKIRHKIWGGEKIEREKKKKIIDAKTNTYCSHILSHNKEVTKTIKISWWNTVFRYQPLNEIQYYKKKKKIMLIKIQKTPFHTSVRLFFFFFIILRSNLSFYCVKNMKR